MEAAKGKLPLAFREDGPPLGLEFDDIPAAVLHSECFCPSSSCSTPLLRSAGAAHNAGMLGKLLAATAATA